MLAQKERLLLLFKTSPNDFSLVLSGQKGKNLLMLELQLSELQSIKDRLNSFILEWKNPQSVIKFCS